MMWFKPKYYVYKNIKTGKFHSMINRNYICKFYHILPLFSLYEYEFGGLKNEKDAENIIQEYKSWILLNNTRDLYLKKMGIKKSKRLVPPYKHI